MKPTEALTEIRAVLWPPTDPDKSWSPDDFDAIAYILDAAGFGRPVPWDRPDSIGTPSWEHAHGQHAGGFASLDCRDCTA